jgi:hypothetical protein
MAASASPDAVDPVFGLAYNPDEVRFEPAPASLLVQCPALTNANWTRKLWIYGEARGPEGIYTVVGGFYAARAGSPAKLMPDPKGALIERTASTCMLLGPAREVLQYPEQLLSPSTLHTLVADLVRRYRVAFGGSAALQATLRDQHATLTDPRDTPLRDALASMPDAR